ncbi:Deoxycytidylate deaminase, partial [Armadillidium vulgare]
MTVGFCHSENPSEASAIADIEIIGIMSKRVNFLPWEDYFMSVAFLSGMRSKDPSSQVGACIVNSDNIIVSIGYNGMPRGCSDDCMPWAKEAESRLETKYICHAEMNAVVNKNSADVAGCRIYVVLFPCNECAKIVIQSRIKEIVYYSDKHKNKPETIASKRMFDMAGISYRKYSPKYSRKLLNFKFVDSDVCSLLENGMKLDSCSKEEKDNALISRLVLIFFILLIFF